MLAGFAAPVIDYPFARSDVAKYERALSARDGADAVQVDDQTWDDMLLDQYSDRLARETSIFGQQELHRRLRGGAAGADSLSRVRALVDDDAGRAALHATCKDLRCAEAEIAETLRIPLSTVKSRLYTARQRLKRNMAAHEGGGRDDLR